MRRHHEVGEEERDEERLQDAGELVEDHAEGDDDHEARRDRDPLELCDASDGGGTLVRRLGRDRQADDDIVVQVDSLHLDVDLDTRFARVTVVRGVQAEGQFENRDVTRVVDEDVLFVGAQQARLGEEIGQGQTVKAALQALIGTTFAAVFESLVLGASAGVKGETMFEVFGSTGVSSPLFKGCSKLIMERKFKDTGSQIATMYKDLGITMAMAKGARQRGVLIERKWQVDGYEWTGSEWRVSVTKMVEKGGNLVPSDETAVITAEQAHLRKWGDEAGQPRYRAYAGHPGPGETPTGEAAWLEADGSFSQRATSLPSLSMERAWKPPPGAITTAEPLPFSGRKTSRDGVLTLVTTLVWKISE